MPAPRWAGRPPYPAAGATRRSWPGLCCPPGRGRVALALLVTMAPFALLAPLIGPLLDRARQGRRFLLAGTLLARGLLCWGMSGAVLHNDTTTLLPAAFGVLVLQKAFGVTR